MNHASGNGLMCLDPDKLERASARLGLSRTRLADDADISRNTVIRAFKGKGIFKDSALRIATQLGFCDPNDLLPEQTDAQSVTADIQEWKVGEYLGSWITASNSLQYRLCRMEHRHLPGRVGRGKCYDMLNPAVRESERMKDCLLRHPTVCTLIQPNPRIAENLATFPGMDGNVWWVVDRWIEGQTLAELLTGEALDVTGKTRITCELALALESLHQHRVVLRELSPDRVVVGPDVRVTVTDFELAKLLDSSPTVSRDWSEDPYRAPEVECGQSSEKADIYSWARITLRLFSGASSEPGRESVAAATRCDSVPPAVRRILAQSLALSVRGRPKNMGRVLGVLRKNFSEAFTEAP